MHSATAYLRIYGFFLISFILCSCATTSYRNNTMRENVSPETYNGSIYAARLPQHITPPGEKLIMVNPRLHAWGAYSPEGNLIHGGLASAGANWCSDLGRACRTRSGSFRIFSLGSASCKSS